MRFIAGRNLQDAGLDLKKSLLVEPAADRAHNLPARQQERPAIDMPRRRPPGRWLVGPGHYRTAPARLAACRRSVREVANTIDIASIFSKARCWLGRPCSRLPAFMSKDSRLVHVLPEPRAGIRSPMRNTGLDQAMHSGWIFGIGLVVLFAIASAPARAEGPGPDWKRL